MRLFYQSFGVPRGSRDGAYGRVLKQIVDSAGTFVTPRTGATHTPEEVAEHIAYGTKTVVLNRLGSLEGLAKAVLSLAWDEASLYGPYSVC